MTDIQQKAMLDLLCTKWMRSGSSYSDSWYKVEGKRRGNKLKIYDAVNHVKDIIQRNGVLVGVFVPVHEVSSAKGASYIAIGTKEQIKFHEVKHVDSNIGIYSLGLWYQSIDIEPITAVETNIRELKE